MGQWSGVKDLLVAFSAIGLLLSLHDMANRSKKQAKANQALDAQKAQLASIERQLQAIYAKLK